ncbi:MAG: hypothetical protein NW237_14430 [Cyanobacteriota bacterium]|nr:hypothetical protein [Cyanobacteriota bacterium]
MATPFTLVGCNSDDSEPSILVTPTSIPTPVPVPSPTAVPSPSATSSPSPSPTAAPASSFNVVFNNSIPDGTPAILTRIVVRPALANPVSITVDGIAFTAVNGGSNPDTFTNYATAAPGTLIVPVGEAITIPGRTTEVVEVFVDSSLVATNTN